MNAAEETAAWRAIDANFNRAVEGLRVVEDHARFVLSDAFLAEKCKTLRHDLTVAIKTLDDAGQRLIARDTLGDVGTSLTTAQESERLSLADVVAANWQRVSQALRVIEEFSKLLGRNADDFENLRYWSYTYAKAFAANDRSRDVWRDRRLYVLIDGRASHTVFESFAKQVIAAGVDVIQLRDKRLSDAELLMRARQLRALIDRIPADEPRPLFIVNDRPDIAVLARADGVHVGQEELPVNEVRRIVGARMQIGVSTHEIEQARAAVLSGADYLGCGPTFPSATKSFSDFPGIPFLQQVAAEISLPAFAIGGITPGNVESVLATGFTRLAIGSAITQAADVAAAVRQVRSRFASPAATPETRPPKPE
jgi:thiamine-phosphate pyrophosphorylase